MNFDIQKVRGLPRYFGVNPVTDRKTLRSVTECIENYFRLYRSQVTSKFQKTVFCFVIHGKIELLKMRICQNILMLETQCFMVAAFQKVLSNNGPTSVVP